MGALFLGVLVFAARAWAQDAPPTPSALEQLVPFVFIFVIFYFLLIRPQRRRHKEHQSFLQKLKEGDEVLTSGGIFGKITGLSKGFVVLEVSQGTRIRVLRNQISSALERDTAKGT